MSEILDTINRIDFLAGFHGLEGQLKKKLDSGEAKVRFCIVLATRDGKRNGVLPIKN